MLVWAVNIHAVDVQAFIDRWRNSQAAERANKDSFLNDLCAALGVPRPEPTTGDARRDDYVFEKAVVVSNERGKSTKFIDLYKRGCFILEAKQGSESGSGKLGTAKRGTATWNVAMNAAFGQAIGYATALDQPPPFLLVTDIGYCFDVYASFDGTARYRPFPNALGHRFHLARLGEHADTLRRVFQDPFSLDPAKAAVEVTREVAGHLAALTKRLEKAGHAPQIVADFLMRCIFTMFAEDVGLLPKEVFTKALTELWLESPRSFPTGVENLWRAMNEGSAFGFFGKLLHFNGGLFKSPSALPLDRDDLLVLLAAAKCSWNRVEPAIFGALFEGALEKKARHALGAHFTPRAYVERLVRPTVEDPIREDWSATQVRIRALASASSIKDAKAETRAFMKRLSKIRVLDPACGSGNFLYVALDLLKAIEDEAFALLLALEGGQAELCIDAPEVTPSQFCGIESNPRAKAIAELVLWIGYLQWHFRTKHRGGKPREPVLADYRNIENRDAVLDFDAKELVLDERTGKPMTRWDGETLMRHRITSELVPDERFTTPVYRYIAPRQAAWPVADFIVGNPPFLGNKRMRQYLNDGYVEALRRTYPAVPESCDLVMYWWWKAARACEDGGVRRFGLITTNSVTQSFNRKLVDRHVGPQGPLSIVFATPDHPWVESDTGAAVRIAMATFAAGSHAGVLKIVASESPPGPQSIDGASVVAFREERGVVHADLTMGTSTTNAMPLQANRGLAGQGVLVLGDGFLLSDTEKRDLLAREPAAQAFVKRFRNGRDLMDKARGLHILDLYGLSEEQLQDLPVVYQRIYDRVRPARQQMRDKARRDRWWLFGRSNSELRACLAGLPRYIATCRTAKHRVFVFLSGDVLPDTKLVAIGSDDAFVLGVLSSKVHVRYATAVGGWLGVGNDPTYNHSACFATFPFPACGETERRAVAKLAEQLATHRDRVLAKNAGLTITSLYNVLEKVLSGQPLDEEEQRTHEIGLVSVLRALHDQLDGAVFQAYGWPQNLTNDEILERLVALNAERAAEEQAGSVQWIRPDYQQTPNELKSVGISRAAKPGLRKSTPPKGPGVRSGRAQDPEAVAAGQGTKSARKRRSH